MAIIDLAQVVEIIVGMTTESIARNLDRNETVVRILKSVNADRLPASDDFDTIYVHALVQYGVFKPEPILNFFRNEYIRDAFRQAFYEGKPEILDKEAESIVQWNEETGAFGHIDYDPRRELDDQRHQHKPSDD